MNRHIVHYKTPLMILFTSAVFAVLPIIPALIGSEIANHSNCKLNESRVHPCQFMGYEVGDLVSTLTGFLWLMLTTIPIGVMGMLISLVWIIYIAFKSN